MLNVLRESFKKTRYLHWVLGLVGLGLVLYLGNYFVGDGGDTSGSGRWAARVNGVEIPDWRFRDAFRRLDEFYREQFGPNYAQFREQLGIREQALTSVVERELVLQNARALGLSASKSEVAERIRTHPAFRDGSGQFVGVQVYQDVVDRSVPGGVASFEQALADDLVAEKWLDLVAQPLTVSDAELREQYRRRTERTGVEYVVVPAPDAAVAPPTEADVQRWYDEHREDYRREEGRRVRYVVVRREALRGKVALEPQEVRAQYDADPAAYAHPEQRRGRQILIGLDPDATPAQRDTARLLAGRIVTRLRAGEDFARLAGEFSTDPQTAARGGDMGWQSRGRMLAAVEQALFDTPVGQLAPVLDIPLGFLVIRVVDARPAGTLPFEEAEPEIRRVLELKKAQELLVAEGDRLRGLISRADRLDEVARQEGLEVHRGFVAAGGGLADLGAGPDLATTVLGLEPGEVSPPLPAAAGMVLVAVDEKVPAGPAPLDEIRDRVRANATAARRTAAAVAAGRRALGSGTDLASTARALGLEIRHEDDLAPGRELDGAGGSSPEVEQALFGPLARVGAVGVAACPAGAVVYRVAKRQAFEEASFEQARSGLHRELLEQRRERYRQALLAQLRTRERIEVNQAVVDSIGPQG